MKCDDARGAFLANSAAEAELDHLALCVECIDERSSLDATRALLEDPALWEEPAAGLEERLVALIGGPTEPAVPRRHRSWLWALGGGAAAAVVAIVVWVALPSAGADWEVALPGTAEAPAASGVVRGWNEPGGTRIALDLEGLPPAPDGTVYEFWFSEGPLHISAGTFVSPESVTLWAGVSRAEFPRLWITLEPLDEDEGPSGTNVMDTG